MSLAGPLRRTSLTSGNEDMCNLLPLLDSAPPLDGLVMESMLDTMDTPLYQAVQDLCNALAGGTPRRVSQPLGAPAAIAPLRPMSVLSGSTQPTSHTPRAVTPALVKVQRQSTQSDLSTLLMNPQMNVSFGPGMYNNYSTTSSPLLNQKSSASVLAATAAEAPPTISAANGVTGTIKSSGVRAKTRRNPAVRGPGAKPRTAAGRRGACSAEDLKCPMCSATFARRDLIKRHIDTIHRDLRNYSCTICDAKFKRSDNLRIHIQRHYKRDKVARAKQQLKTAA